MRLIDVDALKASCEMADDCNSCPRQWRKCNSEQMSRMDFCEYLDEAPTYDAPSWVPIEEQLPGSENVLMYSKKHHDMLFGTLKKVNDAYYCESPCGEESLPEVSHWMAVHTPE